MGDRGPPNDCLCSPSPFTQNTFLKHHVQDNTTGNNGKWKNYVQTYFSFEFFLILCEIAGNPTAVRKYGAIIRLINTPLHGRLFLQRDSMFFMRENLSRRVVSNTRRESLDAIAFGKNRRRVSNTSDLRCRLYFARLVARIVLVRDHLHEGRFQGLESPWAKSRLCKQQIYAIYESPRHSAVHKCFASRWLRLS